MCGVLIKLSTLFS